MRNFAGPGGADKAFAYRVNGRFAEAPPLTITDRVLLQLQFRNRSSSPFSHQISHRPIPAQALVEHSCEGRHAGIDVVVYPNLVFVGVGPVQSSDVLLERAAPGDRINLRLPTYGGLYA